MSRWKAASIHASISVAIGLVVGALLLFVWYPPPYFRAAGADVLVLLLVGVDIVLGPLLTLVVFKSGKRGLRFDLACIALAQAIALAYGLSVVLRSRPVFVVAAVDRFVLVSASDLDAADLAEGSRPEFRSLSYTGPRTVGAILPKDYAERTRMAFNPGGKDIDRLPRLYVDYPEVAPKLLSRARPVRELLDGRGAQERGALASALARIGRAADDVAWVPLVARKANLVMLLDPAAGTPLGAVAVDPWPNQRARNVKQ